MTVQAMRSAVVAIRAGVFDGADEEDVAAGAEASSAGVVIATSRSRGIHRPWRDDAARSVVIVLAGHAGAGASTVALAVSEALADSGRVHLIDFAEPARSGMTAASSIELGADGAWWRRGRRGHLDLFRLAQQAADGQLPSPPEVDGEGRLLVVDAGWQLTTALLETCSAGEFVHDERVVVVTRVTVPAVRQTDHVLTVVGGDAVVAAVGPARWPRAVEASCGPRLAELRSRHRVVRVPIDRRLEITGLTGDRLPKPVAAAGRSLAALLMPVVPPQPRHRRRAEPSRTGPVGESR